MTQNQNLLEIQQHIEQTVNPQIKKSPSKLISGLISARFPLDNPSLLEDPEFRLRMAAAISGHFIKTFLGCRMNQAGNFELTLQDKGGWYIEAQLPWA